MRERPEPIFTRRMNRRRTIRGATIPIRNCTLSLSFSCRASSTQQFVFTVLHPLLFFSLSLSPFYIVNVYVCWWCSFWVNDHREEWWWSWRKRENDIKVCVAHLLLRLIRDCNKEERMTMSERERGRWKFYINASEMTLDDERRCVWVKKILLFTLSVTATIKQATMREEKTSDTLFEHIQIFLQGLIVCWSFRENLTHTRTLTHEGLIPFLVSHEEREREKKRARGTCREQVVCVAFRFCSFSSPQVKKNISVYLCVCVCVWGRQSRGERSERERQHGISWKV